MRICKICKVEKDYTYLCLDGQGRSVHKNKEDGKLWHGKQCSQCFTEYVKYKSGKAPLCEINCEVCGVNCKKKSHHQKTCSKECYSQLQFEKCQ